METSEKEFYEELWQLHQEGKKDQSIGNELRIMKASSALGKGKRLLDIGCGDGSFLELVRERFDEVYGVDISETALRLARSKSLNVKRVNLNIDRLPFEDNFFSDVVSLEVIEHVFDPLSFVREICRVLVPEGNLVLSTPNIRKIQRLFTLAFKGKFPRTSYDIAGYDGGHLHYFTSRDLKDLFHENGLEVVHTDGICGDRRTMQYRLAVSILGSRFENEFLSSAILIKARKK